MTVVTKPISGEKKDDEKACFDDFEGPPNLAFTDDGDERSPSTGVNGARRSNAHAAGMCRSESDYDLDSVVLPSSGGCCKFVTMLVVAIVGLSAGVYFLRSMHMSAYRSGFCSLPYPHSSKEGLITGQFGHPGSPNVRRQLVEDSLVSEMTGTLTEKLVKNELGRVGLEYEMDIELETYEMTQMPELSHGRYIHDFKTNKTLIVDTDNDRCFVMELDRNEISPPKNLMEIIEKIKNGAFELDLDEIRHDTRVILPAMKEIDMKEYGFFIVNSCLDKKTYKLVSVNEIRIQKRSAEIGDSNKFQFIEFGGKHMIKYNILNIDDL